MRVRLFELLAERDMTLYQLAKAAVPRGVSEQSVYKLARTKGRPTSLNFRFMEVLCDIFGVGPGELLERDKGKRK